MDAILLLVAILNLFLVVAGVLSLPHPGGWVTGWTLIGAGLGGAVMSGALASVINELKRIRRVLENQAFGQPQWHVSPPVPETTRRNEPRL